MNRLISHISNKSGSLNKKSLVSYINGRKWFSQDKVVTETEIKAILEKRFPSSATIKVEDVSGGCGAMFNIYIESSEFKGLSIPKQHRTVYDLLKEQIKNIHGLHLETKVPS